MSAAAGPRPAPDRRHPYDRRPAAWRFVWRTVTAILVGLLLAWLGEHLVPSAEAAKRLVADAYLPWATAASDAPVLRWLPDSVRNRIRYADSGQKAITVLSVDDNDLPLFNEKWPPKLEFYASLIDELRDNGARAIFLDLLLLDRRPAADVQALRAAACEARRAGIPVFLASFGSKPAEGTPEQILLMPEPGQSAPCVELVAPHTAQDDFDHAAWEYPLCGRGMQSAALALACAPARKGGSACALDRSIQCPARQAEAVSVEEALSAPHPMDDEAGRPQRMALVWPAAGSAHNSDLLLEHVPAKDVQPGGHAYRRTCDTRLPALRYLLPVSLVVPEDLPDWVRSLVPETVKVALARQALPLCPYADLLPARAFAREGFGLTGQGRRYLIENRTVLIGASFIGHSDRQFTPLKRQLEGVHIHAMALDNLLTLGEGWRRVGEFDIKDWHAPGTLFALVSVMLIVLAWEVQQVLNRWARRREQKLIKPSSDRWFRPLWRGMPRALLFLKNLVLTIVSLGRLPSRRRGRLSGWALAGFVAMSVGLWLAAVVVIFTLANEGFHVGPLSQLEYVLAPAALGFVDHGHRMARALVLLWEATRSPRPAQTIRAYRGMPAADKDDDTPEHVKRDSTFTQSPPPDDVAAAPRDPAP
jgi:hypothetical protein